MRSRATTPRTSRRGPPRWMAWPASRYRCMRRCPRSACSVRRCPSTSRGMRSTRSCRDAATTATTTVARRVRHGGDRVRLARAAVAGAAGLPPAHGLRRPTRCLRSKLSEPVCRAGLRTRAGSGDRVRPRRAGVPGGTRRPRRRRRQHRSCDHLRTAAGAVSDGGLDDHRRGRRATAAAAGPGRNGRQRAERAAVEHPRRALRHLPRGPAVTHRDAERGQVTVLIIGFFLVVGLLTVVVVDASAAYLRNQSLNSLADGAALAAVDGIEGEQVYSGDLDDRAEIDPQLATQYAEQYLDDIGAREDYPGLVCDVDLVGQRAVIEVSAPLTLPFSPPGWDDSTVVTGEASAVVPVT